MRVAKQTKDSLRKKTDFSKKISSEQVHAYEDLRLEMETIEGQIAKIEAEKIKKLEPYLKKLGILDMNKKQEKLEKTLETHNKTKCEIECKILELLNAGYTSEDFALLQRIKRFSVPYKNICESVLNEKELEEKKKEFGGSKKYVVLVFRGEELETSCDEECK